MKKRKFEELWTKYIPILVVIFFIGLIGFLAPYGHERWNFLFENMIWLPFEILITVFAINKVLELIEEKRNREKFIRVTGNKNNNLIYTIKKSIVCIAINCQFYDENRDEKKLYDKIVENPKDFFNKDLFKSRREFNFVNTGKITYNYNGILSVQCDEINTKLNNYIERYEFYLDDELFEKISNFETLNYNIGVLNYKGTILGKTEDFAGDYIEMQNEAINYISKADELIKLLESYKRKLP